jgi:hypothetical protein
VNFRAYLEHLFEQPERQLPRRSGTKFFDLVFGLLRNFVLVGLLKYFYDKTGSTLLFYVHQLALLVLFIYCLSYIDQWYLNLFCYMENRTTAHRLNLTVNVIITVLLFVLVNKATSIMVAELSQAHAEF